MNISFAGGTLIIMGFAGGAGTACAGPALDARAPLVLDLLPMRDSVPVPELLSLLGAGGAPPMLAPRLSRLWKLPVPLLLRESRLPLRGRLPAAVSSAVGVMGPSTASFGRIWAASLDLPRSTLTAEVLGTGALPCSSEPPSTADALTLTGAGMACRNGSSPPASLPKAPCRRRP